MRPTKRQLNSWHYKKSRCNLVDLHSLSHFNGQNAGTEYFVQGHGILLIVLGPPHQALVDTFVTFSNSTFVTF